MRCTSEQDCFQWTSERLVTTRRITEVSRQRIPSRLSSDSEGLTTKWAESITRHKKLVMTGRAYSLSAGDVRGWRNTISQVLRGFVLLTPAHCYAELVLYTFWNVQPVQVDVQQTWQTTIEFAGTTDKACREPFVVCCSTVHCSTVAVYM